MTRTDCYWYHEYQDMNMTVPYCEEFKIELPHCENECKYYISQDDADKIIRKELERREEVNGFKSVGQAWNTSQERWEK